MNCGKWMRVLAGGAALAVVVAGGAFLYGKLTVSLPRYHAPDRTVWTAQNWSAEQRQWFHHADQGTFTFNMPHEWFTALEQPGLFLGAPKLLADPVYLDRLGFIPPVSGALPVGIAKGGPMPLPDGGLWLDPVTGTPFTGIGLTCAACHTGRFDFEDPATHKLTSVFVDGGPALTNLGTLRTATGLAVLYAKYWPGRFDRFAERVLGKQATDAQKAVLSRQLDALWDRLNMIREADAAVAPSSVVEGYGRLDALNRIGNTVFGLDLGQTQTGNYAPYTAPVHYPRIWSAPWFTWVQYDGSIEQPMVRNAGEALGVSAWVDLGNSSGGMFASTVQVKTLFEMERQLAGPQAKDPARPAFAGLTGPKWEDTPLPPIDRPMAEQGAQLYVKYHCQGCHLPPVHSEAFWQSENWKPGKNGARYLDVNQIPLTEIGTDPAQAEGLMARTVTVPPALKIPSGNFGVAPYGAALGDLVASVVTRWYDDNKIPADQREVMNGNRANGIRALPEYKARPLDGIWAAAPYLHNGSVPTIYDLLSPVAERPKKFTLGRRDYDPGKAGFRSDGLAGAFVLDTSLPGNHNTGHAFDDDPSQPGRIGPTIPAEERRALVEYLKTF